MQPKDAQENHPPSCLALRSHKWTMLSKKNISNQVGKHLGNAKRWQQSPIGAVASRSSLQNNLFMKLQPLLMSWSKVEIPPHTKKKKKKKEKRRKRPTARNPLLASLSLKCSFWTWDSSCSHPRNLPPKHPCEPPWWQAPQNDPLKESPLIKGHPKILWSFQIEGLVLEEKI